MKNVLFHVCCAPCLSGVLEGLGSDSSVRGTFYFYNPFIHPFLEYELRRESFREFAEFKELSFMVDEDYQISSFIREAGLSENRCRFCYSKRLEKTARKALELGMSYFSTTLLISPYQKHDDIHDIGERLALKYGIAFYYRDFREFYPVSRKKSKDYGIYRQQYCGCIYSEYERYIDEKSKKGSIRQVKKILGNYRNITNE